MTTSVLQVENLVKRYGDVEAVRGVSFSVEEGEVFGLARSQRRRKNQHRRNPRRTSRSRWRARLRLRPRSAKESHRTEARNRRGAAIHFPARQDSGDGSAAPLLQFLQARPQSRRTAQRFGLEEKRNAFYSQLSGGQKQRLALAMALVNDPKVLFFDEPTAGLDPQVRREIYDIIEELKREKKTIVMTTHYIEEAERLCDRVAIVDHGKVIALGTPRELKEALRQHHARGSPPGKTGDSTRAENPRRCRRRARTRWRLRAALPAHRRRPLSLS